MALAALIVAIAAAVFTGIAALAAISSASASRQSADAADRSARSAAESVDLERARQHRENTPQFTFEEGTHEDPPDSVQLKNLGPIDLDMVTMELNNSSRPGPAEQLGVQSEPEQWNRVVNLGPIALGERKTVLCRRSDAPNREVTLRVRLTCRRGTEEWKLPAETDIVMW
jgi:hypothetical protein